MRIGNDIVDLQAAGEQHPRFAARIMHPDEWLRYEQAGSPQAWIWRTWAAKEAFYKAVRQSQELVFSPRRWLVSSDWLEVSGAGVRLALHIEAEEDLIFAVATDADWSMVVSAQAIFFAEPRPEEQAAEARQLARGLAQHGVLQLEAAEIIKIRGIPRLLDPHTQQSYALSLTHHGRFVGASLLVPPQAV